ncbi:MAG: hypothetical protein FJX52_16880 [Alphaproteobacteria bacterium]|nr:hypothetical protein [Alphaproteobacteria bacterium]
MEKWHPFHQADEYRARKMQLAARGISIGRGVRKVRQAPAPERGTWERLQLETVARWRDAVAEARAQFDWDARLAPMLQQEASYEIPF